MTFRNADRNAPGIEPDPPATNREELEAEMFEALKDYARDETGATAIEYGLIASLIAVAVLSLLSRTGQNLNTKFSSISTALN